MRPSPAGRVGPGEREGYGGPRDVTSLSLSLRLYTSLKSGAKLTRACVPRTVNGTGH